jgi:hypothetical protein
MVAVLGWLGDHVFGQPLPEQVASGGAETAMAPASEEQGRVDHDR